MREKGQGSELVVSGWTSLMLTWDRSVNCVAPPTGHSLL